MSQCGNFVGLRACRDHGRGAGDGSCHKKCAPGEERELSVDGVFVAVGILPNTELLHGLAKLDENGYVRAGEDCATSAQGIFAAGDIRTKALRQVVTAAADGANAITAVQRYLRGER